MPAGTADSPLYRALRAVLGTAARTYFRALEVRHPERLPATGPVLVVANHPASLTDVLVLGAALERPIHFLAYHGLFEPVILGWVLRRCGALPIYRREDAEALMHKNEDTFRACHEILDAGHVVLIFPEGTSLTDRQVQPLKTGAARLALAQEERPGQQGRLTLLPIGLHFVERTAFRSEVVLTIGRPIDLAPFRARATSDPAEAVRELTAHTQTVLEKLILTVPSADAAGLVHDIERLYLDELKSKAPAVPDLALLRGVADCVEYYRAHDPSRLYQVWREVSAYQRKLSALDLRDQAIKEPLRGAVVKAPARLVARGALGLVPALLGVVVNFLPYQLSGMAGGWFARDPTTISFARMVAGVLLFPLSYLLAAMALQAAGWEPQWIGVALASSVPLGFFALFYFRWARRERHRLRLAFLAAGNRRLIARLRSERRRLISLLDAARADYLAAAGRQAEGPAAP